MSRFRVENLKKTKRNYFNLLPVDILALMLPFIELPVLKELVFTEEKFFQDLRVKILSLEPSWFKLLHHHFPTDETQDAHFWYHNNKKTKDRSLTVLRLFWRTYLREYRKYDATFIDLLSSVKNNNIDDLRKSHPRFSDLVFIKRDKKSYPQQFLADESRETTIIYAAARFHRQDILNDFYKLGLTWDEDRGWTSSPVSSLVGPPLHLAVMCNQDEACRHLLLNSAKVDAKGYGETTALHQAAYFGYEGLARLLLQAGANVDAWDNNRHTPLHYAAFNGHAAMVSLLLTCGAMIDLQTVQGRTALFLATFRGHTHAVAILLRAKANLRFDVNPTIREAAVICEHLEICKLLANNCSKEELNQMLAFAVLRKSLEVVRLLLLKGASAVPNLAFTYETKRDVPVTVIAAKNGSAEILDLLFQNHADPLISFEGQSLQNYAPNARIRQICAVAQKRRLKQLHLVVVERFLRKLPEGDSIQRKAAICLKESIEAEKPAPELQKYRQHLQDLTSVDEIFYWFHSLGTPVKDKGVTFFGRKRVDKNSSGSNGHEDKPTLS